MVTMRSLMATKATVIVDLVEGLLDASKEPLISLSTTGLSPFIRVINQLKLKHSINAIFMY